MEFVAMGLEGQRSFLLTDDNLYLILKKPTKENYINYTLYAKMEFHHRFTHGQIHEPVYLIFVTFNLVFTHRVLRPFAIEQSRAVYLYVQHENGNVQNGREDYCRHIVSKASNTFLTNRVTTGELYLITKHFRFVSLQIKNSRSKISAAIDFGGQQGKSSCP